MTRTVQKYIDIFVKIVTVVVVPIASYGFYKLETINDESIKRDSAIIEMINDDRVKIAEIKAMGIKIDYMLQDMAEFKALLKRTVP